MTLQYSVAVRNARLEAIETATGVSALLNEQGDSIAASSSIRVQAGMAWVEGSDTVSSNFIHALPRLYTGSISGRF